MIGRHTGQSDGGTMMFTCPRCRRSFWQPRDYSRATREADELIDAGDFDGARRVVRDALADRE